MLALRSLLFNLAFYLNLIAFMVLGAVFYVTPRAWSIAALKVWARSSLLLLRWIVGLDVEVRGRENLTEGPLLVASKHQSLWETFALLPLFKDPAVVLKRELTYIPLFGWFALKFRMIPVDRSAGAPALRRMLETAEREKAAGRQIIVFPEGTRRAPGAPPAYRPGTAALYRKLDLPCVPIALNSGLFWPRRKFLRYPGTVIVEILPQIPPGLDRRQFDLVLQERIETATDRLVAEAGGPRDTNGTKRERQLDSAPA
ncbi:lysophospholipid acyltransferase family protein [Rhodoligotrophos defluvii]|uniref:lysophospholipid acyltransferase family protein n=1 Tax=Rhodoligotrophos defluvii TaxID=2561934 RepID=UPI0010C9A9F8|nr:lysophospholipid acyltransferase family protein [Rhodoligotrophos defluvii]